MALTFKKGYSVEKNVHHILFDRVSHEANKDNRSVRRSLGMLATMDVFAHRELHRQCPSVPVFGPNMASMVRVRYRPHGNPMIGMENYMRAVEEAAQHPRAHQIDKELASLVIMAVDIQRPFIRQGLVGIEW